MHVCINELIFLKYKVMTGDDIIIEFIYRNSIPQSIAVNNSIKAISKFH